MEHDTSEITTKTLIIAYAAESAEIAMYQALAAAAAVTGDLQTEQLALEMREKQR
jgi:ferritin-like metal-binding protein YciE